MSATIDSLVEHAYANSTAHGFWDDAPEPGTAGERAYLGNKLALIHSEVSEALEELRKPQEIGHTYYREDGKPEGLDYELADIVIRVADLAGRLRIDLTAAIVEKHRFNETRPPKHGKEF